jgi:hypothetical protein
MTFLVPTTVQARLGLRAMKTTLLAGGGIEPTHREALAAVQRHLLRTDFDLDALEPIEPEELARGIDDPALREQLVNALVTFSMLSERIDPRHSEKVDAFAHSLDVAPVAIRQLRNLAEGHLLRLRIDSMRQGPGSIGLARLYEDGGLVGLIKNVLGFAGIIENPEIVARYRSLEAYPEGTLGKTLFDFYTSRGFKFPGEKGGAPEGLLPHDLTHILGGYGTDIQGEGRVLAFTAGYQREKMFGTLLFILIQGQHGVRLTPLADAYDGFLKTPNLVTDMVEAFARGSRMNTDLMARWDFWAVMDQPVDELRRRYAIPDAGGA